MGYDIWDEEFFEEPEVSKIIDELKVSLKNRILWRIFYTRFLREGSFIRTFGRLMWFGGYYRAYKDYHK